MRGGEYLAIKKDLNEILPTYIEEFADKGIYKPNWLIYGSDEEELVRHFGDRYPASIVSKHVYLTFLEETGRDPEWHVLKGKTDSVLKDLAVEGIKHNYLEYIRYAFDRISYLYEGFSYYYYYGEWININDTGENRDKLKQILSYEAGQGYDSRIRDRLQQKVGSGNDGKVVVKDRLKWLSDLNIRLGGKAFQLMHYLLLIGVALLIPYNWKLIKSRQAFFAMIALLIVVSYTVLLGLINVAEPSRFIVNVQDLIVIGEILIILLGVRAVTRILIAGSLQTKQN